MGGDEIRRSSQKVTVQAVVTALADCTVQACSAPLEALLVLRDAYSQGPLLRRCSQTSLTHDRHALVVGLPCAGLALGAHRLCCTSKSVPAAVGCSLSPHPAVCKHMPYTAAMNPLRQAKTRLLHSQGGGCRLRPQLDAIAPCCRQYPEQEHLLQPDP